MSSSDPTIASRRALGRTLAGAAFIAGLRCNPGQAQTLRPVTPGQTEGPYYPRDWSGDIDADLVVVQGEAARAQGEIVHLHGRVLTAALQPIAGARIEIWQCDAKGIYRHPRDERDGRRHDAGFQGRGRNTSDGDGARRASRPPSRRCPRAAIPRTAPNGRG